MLNRQISQVALPQKSDDDHDLNMMLAAFKEAKEFGNLKSRGSNPSSHRKEASKRQTVSKLGTSTTNNAQRTISDSQ